MRFWAKGLAILAVDKEGSMIRRVAFVLFCCFFSGLGAVALAEPDPCGEWTVCAKSPPTSVPVPRQATNASECTDDNELTCRNKCHGQFGGEFWRCVNGCLGKSCAGSAGTSGGTTSGEWAAQQDTRECLELGSEDCKEECGSHEGTSGARCRRDCLSKKCPQSSASLIAKESASPGAVKCDRCVEQYRPECRQACAAGTWVAPSGVLTNLGGLVCEKSCLGVRCGVGCEFNF